MHFNGIIFFADYDKESEQALSLIIHFRHNILY